MKLVYKVPSISCQRCVDGISNALSKVGGIASFHTDLESKILTVEADADISARIIDAVEDIGHEIEKA